MSTNKNNNLRIVVFLGILVTFMFGFGYAMVPMYNSLCKKFGLNGRSGDAGLSTTIDMSRTITVQFLATNNANLQWQFYPEIKVVKVHPGENRRIAFYAMNDTEQTMTVQAIPSVSPGIAAKYLKKTECFCFKQQTFGAKQHMDMPVLFHLDTDIPKNIHVLTLSYTLFDVTGLKKTVVDPEREGKL
jgi:cytochrome c oxidase assembly protein subunit 11